VNVEQAGVLALLVAVLGLLAWGRLSHDASARQRGDQRRAVRGERSDDLEMPVRPAVES
jgi:hypothetical protein